MFITRNILPHRIGHTLSYQKDFRKKPRLNLSRQPWRTEASAADDDSGELKEPLVERAGVVVIAVFSGERRAAFVEAAREDDVAAEPRAGPAGRTLGEVGRGVVHMELKMSLASCPPLADGRENLRDRLRLRL